MTSAPLFERTTSTSTTTRPRPRIAPATKPHPVERCNGCGDEKVIYARGRVWCVSCDASEVFGTEVRR